MFYELTWYEYMLTVRRYEHTEKEKFHAEEMQWARFRIQWADFRNANRGKGKIVRPADLIPLSFDIETPENKRELIGSKKMREMMGSTFNRADGKQ
jgi:hypothetical protein